ncbi:MAG: methyltransferase [Bacteroidetes bacterium]|nr:methyltransferase [Bacteroidota bacterium]
MVFKIKPGLPDDNCQSANDFPVLKINANERLFMNDTTFDRVYPNDIRIKSKKHWTPLNIARKAADFLAEPDATVLDIGSGAGKFCLAGAYDHPEIIFCGVEQRHDLVLCAEAAKNHMGLTNAHFLYANMTQVKFSEFDHFYFYNSFYENIDGDDAIDNSIETSYSLYSYYTRYLYAELEKKPPGTKLVTFHSAGEEVPKSFRLADISFDMMLQMWIKM